MDALNRSLHALIARWRGWTRNREDADIYADELAAVLDRPAPPRQWEPQTCDKCKHVVPSEFMCIEVEDGHPIDDPAGFMWCIVCHSQRVLTAFKKQIEELKAESRPAPPHEDERSQEFKAGFMCGWYQGISGTRASLPIPTVEAAERGWIERAEFLQRQSDRSVAARPAPEPDPPRLCIATTRIHGEARICALPEGHSSAHLTADRMVYWTNPPA